MILWYWHTLFGVLGFNLFKLIWCLFVKVWKCGHSWIQASDSNCWTLSKTKDHREYALSISAFRIAFDRISGAGQGWILAVRRGSCRWRSGSSCKSECHLPRSILRRWRSCDKLRCRLNSDWCHLCDYLLHLVTFDSRLSHIFPLCFMAEADKPVLAQCPSWKVRPCESRKSSKGRCWNRRLTVICFQCRPFRSLTNVLADFVCQPEIF